MTYTIHLGTRDDAGWLPEVAQEPTRPQACARAKALLAAGPHYGAEVRHRRRLVDSFVKRHPSDTGVGIPAGRRRYFGGIWHAFSTPVRSIDAERHARTATIDDTIDDVHAVAGAQR
ncbi:MAG TPA: hypothetical protein VN193_02710 [Candidatus Angelobacter sp.]|jgi:hypothetical protein|nr:hypothetical protein [Candidatus Angelobacter sp.]